MANTRPLLYTQKSADAAVNTQRSCVAVVAMSTTLKISRLAGPQPRAAKRILGFDPATPHVYITRCVRCGDETTVWVAFMLWTDVCRRHLCARCVGSKPSRLTRGRREI